MRMIRATFLFLVLQISLAACAGGDSVVIRPLDEITQSDPEFTDIRARSATLLLDTTIPVACSAVYGSTQDYGQIATDTDMAGGAHQDHHPVLTGLEPDTLYYVRLQGVGPDGTLYRSEEFTFRTPAADPNEQLGPTGNLASAEAGAQVSGVSSNFGGGDNESSFGALNAIDGDPSTQWSSDGDGDQAWIEIELAQETQVNLIGFWTRTMGSSAQINEFQIVTDQGEIIGPFSLPDPDQIHYFETDFIAKRLRFEARSSSGGNTGAVEIEVFGSPLE